MKMPRRPFYPVDLGPDVFGLPRLTLLEMVCESDSETAKRYDTIERWLSEAFRDAVLHLGEQRARELFSRISRIQRGRGKGKQFAPDRDIRLLAAYDEGAAKRKNLRTIADELHRDTSKLPSHFRLGSTVEAIETQIRILLKERSDERKKRAFEATRWRMALSKEPLSLLVPIARNSS